MGSAGRGLAAVLGEQRARALTSSARSHYADLASRHAAFAERGRPQPPSLTELAQKHGTDKWGTKHQYTPHYEATLAHLRLEQFTLLEIGIGGYSRSGQGGESLRMWRDYFPHASIVGLDLHDKSFVADDRIRVYQGDQSDADVLSRIVTENPDLKVVVDDGSHICAHVIASFHILFPLLPQDGIYAIEDTQTSYWTEYGGQIDPTSPGTSMDMVKRLIDGLNHEEFRVEGYQPSYTDENVVAIHAWHNLVIIEKGRNLRRPLPVTPVTG